MPLTASSQNGLDSRSTTVSLSWGLVIWWKQGALSGCDSVDRPSEISPRTGWGCAAGGERELLSVTHRQYTRMRQLPNGWVRTRPSPGRWAGRSWPRRGHERGHGAGTNERLRRSIRLRQQAFEAALAADDQRPWDEPN